jgi:hypothetical protein
MVDTQGEGQLQLGSTWSPGTQAARARNLLGSRLRAICAFITSPSRACRFPYRAASENVSWPPSVRKRVQ